MNKPIVINLFGPPGSGKSTGAAEVFAALKKLGINAELVTEFAKDKTWEHNATALGCQEYVFGKQSYRLARCRNEVDVIVTDSSIARMVDIAQRQNIGMVAAVTHNDNGKVNFPYEYAQKYSIGAIETRKRLSFCCTLMTVEMLQRVDFDQLNPEKDWFDVTITRLSREQGLTNILLTDVPVRHYPHSSRPWKQLKYTHPLRYYWRKIFYAKDKI